jgi:hypothetical protein
MIDEKLKEIEERAEASANDMKADGIDARVFCDQDVPRLVRALRKAVKHLRVYADFAAKEVLAEIEEELNRTT